MLLRVCGQLGRTYPACACADTWKYLIHTLFAPNATYVQHKSATECTQTHNQTLHVLTKKL